MTDADKALVKDFVLNVLDTNQRRLPIVEACMMASQLPPQEWSDAVLFPYYDRKDRAGASIFGNHQHQAMDRTRTISLMDALLWVELCESKGEVRKAIKNNGVMVNRKKMTDPNYILSEKDALPNIDAIVLEFGKYNFGIIELC